MILKFASTEPRVFGQVAEALIQAEGKPVELLVRRGKDGQTRIVYKRALLYLLSPRAGDEITGDKDQVGSILGLGERAAFNPLEMFGDNVLQLAGFLA